MRRLLVVTALLAACHDVPFAPPTPTALQIVGGDGQTGVPGYLLANPIVVKLADDAGKPVPGDTLTFTAADATGFLGLWPNAAFAPTSRGVTTVVTDSQGIAKTTWRIGQSLGTQELTVRSTYPGVQGLRITAAVNSNRVVSIAGTMNGLCAIDGQGRLGCWVPPRLSGGPGAPVFTLIQNVPLFTQVVLTSYPASSPAQGCALAVTGRPYCFTLGDNAAVLGMTLLPGSYPAFSTLAGQGTENGVPTYCALAADGQAWCWGRNVHSQLGVGSTNDGGSPQPVGTAARFAQIDVGESHVCALTSSGDPWCWGFNSDGQTGQPGQSSPTSVPTPVATALKFSRVFASGSAFIDLARVSCGIGVSVAGLFCWGDLSSISSAAAVTGGVVTPTAIPGAGSVIDFGENTAQDRRLYLLTSKASLLAASSGQTPTQWSPYQVVRDILTRHGRDYLCGTALDGLGTLCVRTLVPSDFGPWNVPTVIGVPLP